MIPMVPARATVTEETLGTREEYSLPMEIAPGTEAWCTSLRLETTTWWWKDSVILRQATGETITGTCDGGITFECSSGGRVNSRETGPVTGICRFTSSDGRTWQKLFHRSSVNGETRVEFETWR